MLPAAYIKNTKCVAYQPSALKSAEITPKSATAMTNTCDCVIHPNITSVNNNANHSAYFLNFVFFLCIIFIFLAECVYSGLILSFVGAVSPIDCNRLYHPKNVIAEAKRRPPPLEMGVLCGYDYMGMMPSIQPSSSVIVGAFSCTSAYLQVPL